MRVRGIEYSSVSMIYGFDFETLWIQFWNFIDAILKLYGFDFETDPTELYFVFKLFY